MENDKLQNAFSQKLIALRKGMGWTQENLAELCGITRQAVAKWESGQSVPDIFRVAELAKLYQVDVSDLMSQADEATIDSEKISMIRARQTIIDSLSMNYDAVYLSNLDSGKVIFSYSAREVYSREVPPDLFEIFHNCFSEELAEFHKKVVHPDDYERFKHAIDRDVIYENLIDHEGYSVFYRSLVNGQYKYFMTRYIRTADFSKTHNFVVGVVNVDNAVREAKALNWI